MIRKTCSTGAFLLIGLGSISLSTAAVWDYVLQGADWTGTCATGLEQSPINVVTANVADIDPTLPSPTLSLNGIDTVFDVVNDGHTYKFVPAGSQHSVLYDLPEGYAFQQYHFHAPAEHTYDGTQRTLEFHAVFGSTATVPNPRSHIVVGITFVPLNTASTHQGLQAVIDAGAPAESQISEVADARLDLSMFLPDNTSLEMVSYPGSLTTPECSEVVNWMMFTQAVSVPPAQLAYFTNAFAYPGTLGNYREVDAAKNPGVLVRRVPWSLTASDPTSGQAPSLLASSSMMYLYILFAAIIAVF